MYFCTLKLEILLLTNGMGILDDLIGQCGVLHEVRVLRKLEPIDNTGSWLLEWVYKACVLWLRYYAYDVVE